MKKFFDRIKKLKNNIGSGIILVIVAMGFIGILTGALLTAVGYAYKQKLYDYNARDNFYYLEQAMDEINSGVGNSTIECLQKAYQDTVEAMTMFDFDEKAYVSIDEKEANRMFKENFMKSIKENYYDQIIADLDAFTDTLESYISNDTVVLDKSNIAVIMYKSDNTVYVPNGANFNELDRIVIRNVTVSRTVNYNRSQANGTFEQKLSADIVIAKPDFDVKFSNILTNFSTIFDYAVIADMGLEITQPAASPLTINGNVYAASDYYNKQYNLASGDLNRNYSITSSNEPGTTSTIENPVKVLDDYNDAATPVEDGEEPEEADPLAKYKKSVYSEDYESSGTTYTRTTMNYKLTPVTSKSIAFSAYDATAVYSDQTTYFNTNEFGKSANRQLSNYDGVNVKSRNSGLYIGGSDVTIVSDMLIVPGTIAVMDNANLSTFGSKGNQVHRAEIWADNIVLGGEKTAAEDKPGSSATFNGDVYVKDDLELNTKDAQFKLVGAYYGYGDSTRRDNRVFTPMVNPDDFKEKNSDDNRGHYNSSAIIVNGDNATLDLSKADSVFIAGRSYVELSKDTENHTTDTGRTYTTYKFDNETADYRTGESISVKSNQIAYKSNGNKFEGVEVANTDGTVTIKPFEVDVYNELGRREHTAYYYKAYLNDNQKNSDLFQKFFTDSNGKLEWVPVTKIVKKDKTDSSKDQAYYYYNFEAAYALGLGDTELRTQLTGTNYNPESIAQQFIIDYNYFVQNDPDFDSVVSSLDDEENGFQSGDVKLAGSLNSDQTRIASGNIYSSGALTLKSETADTFNIVTSNSTATYNLEQALGNDSRTVNNWVDVYGLAWGLSEKYDSVKFSLTDNALNANAQLSALSKNIVNKDTSQNKTDYAMHTLVQGGADDSGNTGVLHGESAITPINTYMNFNRITPSSTAISPSNLDLDSEYKVWVSYNDLTINETGKVSGIIISKGDVIFGKDVTEFNGLVISGSKVYVTDENNITKINANSEICKAVIRALQLNGTDEAKYVLSLFKDYESAEVIKDKSDITEAIEIGKIDYTNVMRYDNWTKSVR